MRMRMSKRIYLGNVLLRSSLMKTWLPFWTALISVLCPVSCLLQFFFFFTEQQKKDKKPLKTADERLTYGDVQWILICLESVTWSGGSWEESSHQLAMWWSPFLCPEVFVQQQAAQYIVYISYLIILQPVLKASTYMWICHESSRSLDSDICRYLERHPHPPQHSWNETTNPVKCLAKWLVSTRRCQLSDVSVCFLSFIFAEDMYICMLSFFSWLTVITLLIAGLTHLSWKVCFHQKCNQLYFLNWSMGHKRNFRKSLNSNYNNLNRQFECFILGAYSKNLFCLTTG